MKKLFLLLSLLISFGAQALTLAEMEVLLRAKGLSVGELQARNMQVFMGENTGHLEGLPFNRVHVLLTESEAILKHEIESVDLSGQTLGGLKSLRHNGQYILKQDVKAVISIR